MRFISILCDSVIPCATVGEGLAGNTVSEFGSSKRVDKMLRKETNPG